ncbi:MAG: hypothetical protein QOF87_459 [Pseudonocardiales bacterium]|jgi:early secretory antigenic target protein ESAT-6|nr:family type secretion target [Pseudonocardiales bacterium]MDT4958827.1 hypothetical protein [Pseudonocardiales bacterium]MDT4960812.1 hypothetical protein [Pseudonocardiales bacterium]MDT4971845.1 hypothetical protein [Pseudonocardiales bacterium]MDT4977341.1 hypothetical protein [Pseudonocardiales bacterium]
MSEIHVQFESLAAGQQGIRNNYQKLTATIEQLESDLAPMIATWSGAAQASYVQCKAEWDKAAAALALVLNNVSTAVGDAHQNYTAAERAAQSNWA